MGASMDGAEFHHVEGHEADFTGIRAARAVWRSCELTGSYFERAGLARAEFRDCRLERVSFSGARLGGGAIVDSTCTHANFQGANLLGVETVGSTFQGAELSRARNFAASHELVAEALRHSLSIDDTEGMLLVAAVLSMRKWCYAEWKAHLSAPDMLAYYALALEALGNYEESGARQALEAGADWRR